MTNQKQFIESKLSKLSNKIDREAWHEANCPAHSNQMRPESECNCLFSYIKESVLPEVSTALKEIVEEHFKEIMVEKFRLPEKFENMDYYRCRKEGFNQALDQITSRHNKFLE